MKNYQNIFQKREGGFFERFVGVGVRVAKFFYWQVARNLATSGLTSELGDRRLWLTVYGPQAADVLMF